MTIKEKLCEPLGKFYTETSKELEQIADEYAIGFAFWLLTEKDETKTLREMLEIFKKEKGL